MSKTKLKPITDYRNVTIRLPNDKCIFVAYNPVKSKYMFVYTINKPDVDNSDKQVMINRISSYGEENDFEKLPILKQVRDIYGKGVLVDNNDMCKGYIQYLCKSVFRVRYRYQSYSVENLQKFFDLVDLGIEKPYIPRRPRVW